MTAHYFNPYFKLTERADGRYDVTIDWSDAYQDSATDDGADKYLGEKGESGHLASLALDEWIKRQPKTFIIDGPPHIFSDTDPDGPCTDECVANHPGHADMRED